MTRRNESSVASPARRRFMQGAAALGVSGGLLGLLGSLARAGGEPPGLRFFFMFTGNGHQSEHFVPSNPSATDFDFAPALAALEPHRADLMLVHGVSGPGSHHQGTSEALTGRPSSGIEAGATGGPSLDQLFADRFRATSALPSLELGVSPANSLEDQITFSASGLPVPAIGSAAGGFNRLFGLANEDPARAEARRARKHSVLDVIADDLTTLQGRLDAPTRALLDEHLTLIRAQEDDLEQPYVPVSCELGAAPAGAGLVATFEGQMANVVTAFRCGITRVATLRVGGYGGIEEGAYDEIGVNNGHHNAAHVGPASDLLGINGFHAEQFASLIAQLAAIPEGDGRLLDNTVLVWGMELGLGQYAHDRNDMPFVIAGGKNAGLALGRYEKLDGRSYQDFLFSLVRVMGLDDVGSFGDGGTQMIEELMA
ncbi:MAG TPA: DUF1552 domain-containing protein [Nannocystaceae bacterium]|nr:DUF1552 domain-containing protein [Nannocystaceae bacterium]